MIWLHNVSYSFYLLDYQMKRNIFINDFLLKLPSFYFIIWIKIIVSHTFVNKMDDSNG